MIKLNNISKRFKDEIVFDDVSTCIGEDNLTLLMGPSGSGKSTLINIISGKLKPDNGEIIIFGQENNWKNVHSNISFVSQDLELFDELTILDNLKIFCNDEAIINDLLTKFEMNEHANKKIKHISGGQKQRVAIVRALISKPKILFLDEPSNGLDKKNFDILIDTIKEVINFGMKVVVITHDERFIDSTNSIIRISDNKLSYKLINENEMISNQSSNLIVPRKISINSALKITKNYSRLFSNNILIMGLISLIFISVFGFTFGRVLDYKEEFLNGMTDQIIIMDINNVIDKYVSNEGNEYTFEAMHLDWNADDVKNIEAIDGVEFVKVDDENISSKSDYLSNFYFEEFQTDEYMEAFKGSLGITSMPEVITLESKTVLVSSDIIDYYKGPDPIDIIAGEYPTDGTLEILIPDFMARYIFKTDDYDSVINQEIDLNVENRDDNLKRVQTYTISGVYNSNYKTTINDYYNIYFPRLIDEPPTLENELNYFERGVENYPSKRIDSYYDETYASVESYAQALGYSCNKLYIVVEPGKLDEVLEQLDILYPNYIKESTRLYTKGNEYYKDTFGTIEKIIKLIILFSSIFFGLIIYLVQRSYYIIKRRDYLLLKSNGFANLELLKLMLIEFGISILSVIILSSITLIILNFVPLKIFNATFDYVFFNNGMIFLVAFLVLVSLIQLLINYLLFNKSAK